MSWQVGVVLLLLMWVLRLASAFNVTVEDRNELVQWHFYEKKPFHVMSGQDGTGRRGYPGVDYTTGTDQGKFWVVAGNSDDGQGVAILYSPCSEPTGRKCAFQFATWMSESQNRSEQLNLVQIQFCDKCPENEEVVHATELPYVVTNDQPGRWISHRVELGVIHSLFMLALRVFVPDDDSVFALDSLSLLSCDIELEQPVCSEEEFRCPNTEQCIPVRARCDQKQDCTCGQDEAQCSVTVGSTDDADMAIVIVLPLVVCIAGFSLCVLLFVSRGNGRWSWCIKLRSRDRINAFHPTPIHLLSAASSQTGVIRFNSAYSLLPLYQPDHSLPKIAMGDLRVTTQIGRGAFGEVYKGFMSDPSGAGNETAVAIKTLPQVCSEQTGREFFMEALIISQFCHCNIVRFIGVCFQQQRLHCIVLELLEGGNLKSFLRDSRPADNDLSELRVGDLIALAKDICSGCCYLEEHQFIHRDIAARNCLLTSKGPDRTAKIADFGMSRDIYRVDYYKKEGRAFLPVKWMPPEAFDDGIFTTKTDVWSFGVLLWETFTLGYMPYPALSNTDVIEFVRSGGRLACPKNCPSAVYDMMGTCWKHSSDARPTFTRLKQSLDAIAQDAEAMSEHLPACCLPRVKNEANLKLFNYQAPGLDFSLRPDVQVQDSAVSPVP